MRQEKKTSVFSESKVGQNLKLFKGVFAKVTDRSYLSSSPIKLSDALHRVNVANYDSL